MGVVQAWATPRRSRTLASARLLAAVGGVGARARTLHSGADFPLPVRALDGASSSLEVRARPTLACLLACLRAAVPSTSRAGPTSPLLPLPPTPGPLTHTHCASPRAGGQGKAAADGARLSCCGRVMCARARERERERERPDERERDEARDERDERDERRERRV